MKLSDWAKKQGIAYLTAYRWFKDGKLPVEAYQSDSGTIIVKDEEVLEQQMASHSNGDQSSEVMSAFIKKTVEFSKNNSTIEEFAAYILSNFSLKFSFGPEVPKYSKNKPKSEDIQKHFQQFMKKGEKPKVNVFLEATGSETIDDLVAKADSLTAQELIEQIHEIGEQGDNSPTPPELSDLLKALAPNSTNVTGPKVYGDTMSTEGMVSRTVDFDSTPQQINYTSSTDHTFSDSTLTAGVTTACASSFYGSLDGTTQTFVGLTNNAALMGKDPAVFNNISTATAGGALGLNYNQVGVASTMPTAGRLAFPTAAAFMPTQKELSSASKVVENAPRRRGRKPSKNKSQE